MPRNGLVRIATAGGFRNPALNLNFVPDLASAHQNALATQRSRMTNQIVGQQIADYPEERNYLLQQRANAAADRQSGMERQSMLDNRSGFLFMGKALATMPNAESYFAQMDNLKNGAKVPEVYLRTRQEFEAEAMKTGTDIQTVYDKYRNMFLGPQQQANTEKNIFRNEKIDDRWFEIEIDPQTNLEVNRKPMYKQTETQAKTARNRAAVSGLQKKADIDPMGVYASGIRMNDDGTVFTNPLSGAAVELPNFTNTLGKRANMKVIKQVGEHVDDALEVYAALQDPKVQVDLKKAQDADLWDSVAGKWKNTVKRWMVENGIASNTRTYRTIMHMQRMASEQRKTFLGTAVTQTELQSILGWLPNAGDSYDSMLGKITLAAEEGYEEFKRFLDINKNDSNMAPFYRAWGLDRFNMPGKDIESLSQSAMAPPNETQTQSGDQGSKPDIQTRGDELEKQGLPKREILKILRQEYGK